MSRADRRWQGRQSVADTERLLQVGRLALRVEGESWNAYWAMPDTMRGALFLGSIRMNFVVDHPERKEAFMALLREGISDLIEAKTGHRPEWPGAVAAPEHERSGNA